MNQETIESPEAPASPAPAPESIYLDTTVPSYFAARWTREMPMLRHQRITCLWWHGHRERSKVYVSPRVFAEAQEGDPVAAQRRFELIASFQSLDGAEEAKVLEDAIMVETRLPVSAKSDAEHIAIAATNDVKFLLTWNCKHLANPQITPKVKRACERTGFRTPEICTPEAIMRKFPLCTTSR